MKLTVLFVCLMLLPVFLFAQNHLLISEIQVAPDSLEFIEIFNPNDFPVGLDSIYLADYNSYFEIVNNSFSTVSTDFMVKFPDSTQIDSAGVLVIAVNGTGFLPDSADFEIKSTILEIPDMVPMYLGSSTGGMLSNSEMMILFYWDGVSNRVYDVDYAIWGSTTSNFVDKTGIAPYAPDTPVGSQRPSAKPITGFSMTRTNALELGETFSGGNGISGHDETSEPIDQNFNTPATPTPGTTNLTIPTGNGSGEVTVVPDSVPVDTVLTLSFTIKGTVEDTLTTVSVEIPSSWSWTGSLSDIQLSGSAFISANPKVNDNTITIENARVTLDNSGVIQVNQLTTPTAPEVSLFQVETAVFGGTLTRIGESPTVTVWKPAVIMSIAEVQNDPLLVGQQVTIEGIVVLGAGITTTGWTDGYVQDTSNTGINIYRAGEVDTSLNRGYRVRITGTVAEFSGVTEITDYTLEVLSKNNPVPEPVAVTTQGANNVAIEGTFIEVSGEVTDFAPDVGGGTNIRVNDGSGECLVRVWNTTGVDLSSISIGKQVKIRGPLDIYQGATQLLLAYQEDFTVLESQPGDGSGTATVTPDSVAKGATNIDLDFTLQGETGFVLETISLTVPQDWQWSGNYQLQGFAGAQVQVTGNRLTLTQASLTGASEDHIILQNLTAPNSDGIYSFVVKTAVAGGVLTSIASNPMVVVGQGIVATPISDIQTNTAQYQGQQVTILGVVVLGAGITTTSWTDTYVQDNSGYGINVYQSGTIDANLKRGNRVVVTGTVDEFNGVTEIVDYTVEVLSENNKLPAPLILSTAEANDVRWEGTYIQVEGEITDLYSAGGGTNIQVDDGSGATLLRIWDSAGLNLSAFAVGDTIIARAPMDIYQGAAQLVVAYQEDIFKPGAGVVGDGSGFAVIQQDSVATGTANISVTLDLWSTPEDTIRTVHVLLPNTWQWSGQAEQVSLSGKGFANSEKKIVLEYGEYRLELTGCFLTAQDSGSITISGLTAPANSQYAYFWVKTAVAGGQPQFISASPRLVVGKQPVYLVRDLQVNSAQFKDAVTVEGVVTVGAGVLRTDRTSAYLQDASGYGINLSKSGQPDTLHFKRGYLVRVNGMVSEYRETTQFDPQTVEIIDSTNTQLPAPVKVSTGDANSPHWDGILIQVRGVVTEKYTTSTQAPFDYNLVVNDGTGATTLRVWGTTQINLDSIEVNKAVIASGVGSVFIDRDGNPNYQLLPAYQEDIVLDPTYQPTLEGISLEVPPNPFVPDRGEKIKIRYNAGAVNNRVTIRIFDLGGRLITTILDEDAQLIVNTLEWDGRNDFLDYVPLGTFICHLEVVEPVSGKKKTRVAPIVVGTVLNK